MMYIAASAKRRICGFLVSEARHCSGGVLLGENGPKSGKDERSKEPKYGKHEQSEEWEKPSSRSRLKRGSSKPDLPPNPKRSLHRMERSMEMCESDLPDSIFKQVLDEEKRAEKEEMDAEMEEKRRKKKLTLALVERLKETTTLNDCRIIHDEIRRNEITDPYVGNLLVQAYNRFKEFESAREVFARIQPKNVYSYNFMLKACIRNERYILAKKLFVKMQKRGVKPDGFTVATVASAYARTGHLLSVRRVFNGLENKSVPTWTAMIAAYTQTGKWKKALRLLRRMELEGVSPNELTIASAIEGCKDIRAGVAMHERALANCWSLDLILGNAFVGMYTKCGKLDEARNIFENMDRRPVSSWTVLINGYLRDGQPEQSIKLFKRMIKGAVAPCNATYVGAFAACSKMRDLESGKEFHEHAVMRRLHADEMIVDALLEMYIRFSSLEDARKVFDGMKNKDVRVWNKMLVAYSRKGLVKDAVELYEKMEEKDGKTYLTMLVACTDLQERQDGKGLRCKPTVVAVAEALINAYAKLGNLDAAVSMFGKTRRKLKYAEFWNPVISVLTESGHGGKALELYHLMLLEGVMPNSITFTAVFHACGESLALQERGRDYFRSMAQDYKLKPGESHYRQMVDLLGRQGTLGDAEELIVIMPKFAKDAGVWSTLLAACKTHKDASRAKRVARKISELKRSGSEVKSEESSESEVKSEDVKEIVEEEACHDSVVNVDVQGDEVSES